MATVADGDTPTGVTPASDYRDEPAVGNTTVSTKELSSDKALMSSTSGDAPALASDSPTRHTVMYRRTRVRSAPLHPNGSLFRADADVSEDEARRNLATVAEGHPNDTVAVASSRDEKARSNPDGAETSSKTESNATDAVRPSIAEKLSSASSVATPAKDEVPVSAGNKDVAGSAAGDTAASQSQSTGPSAETTKAEASTSATEKPDGVTGASVDVRNGPSTSTGDTPPRPRLARRPSALKLLQLAQLRLAPHAERLSTSFLKRISPPRKFCEPRSATRIRWNLAGFCFTIYCAVTVPFRSAFGVNTIPLMIIDLVCDLFFLCDIYLNFHTGVMQEGILVMNKDKCVEGYLKKWFSIDLLSMLPLDDILRLAGIDVTFWDRFARILRMSRFGSYLAAYEMKSSVPALVRLTKLLLLMFLLIHWTACIYFCLALRVGLGEDDFVPPARFIDASAFSQYVHCLYFSTSALTGSGNVNAPVNDLEISFSLCCMVVGFLMFATIVGNIGEVLADMHRIMSQFRQKMDLLQQYMKHRGIPREIQERIRVHYDYLADRKQVIDERTILDDLPMYLRREIAVFLNYETLMKVGIFKDCEPGFINSLALKLKAEVFSPDEYIIRKNEIGSEMFFISKGQVEVVDETGKTIFATLGEGTYFGEVALLLQERRTASVRAKTFCDLFSLNKADFDEVLEDYPLAAEKMLIEAQRRISMLKNSKSVRLRKRWNDAINLVIALNKFQKVRPKMAEAAKTAAAAAAAAASGSASALLGADDGAKALPQRRMGRMRSSTISSPSQLNKPFVTTPPVFGGASLSTTYPGTAAGSGPSQQPLTIAMPTPSVSAPATPTITPGTLFIRHSDDAPEEGAKRGTPPSRRRSMSVNAPPAMLAGMPPLRRQISSIFNAVSEEGGDEPASPRGGGSGSGPGTPQLSRPLSVAANSSAGRDSPVGMRKRSTSLSSMANAVALAKAPIVPVAGGVAGAPGILALTEAGAVVVPVLPVQTAVQQVLDNDLPSPLLRKTLMKSNSATLGRKRGQSVSSQQGPGILRRRPSMEEDLGEPAAGSPLLKRTNSLRGSQIIRSRQSSGTNLLEGAIPVAVVAPTPVVAPVAASSFRIRGNRARSSSLVGIDISKLQSQGARSQASLARMGSGLALVPLPGGAGIGAVALPQSPGKYPVRRNSKSFLPDVSAIKPQTGSSTEEELVSDMSSDEDEGGVTAQNKATKDEDGGKEVRSGTSTPTGGTQSNRGSQSSLRILTPRDDGSDAAVAMDLRNDAVLAATKLATEDAVQSVSASEGDAETS